MVVHHRGALRLVLAQPVHRALEAVDAVERVHVAVGDDAEAGAAGAERDQPDPVAGAHQVIGAQPAQPVRHARLPCGIAGPVVHFHARADAKPAGVGAVSARPRQTELPLQQSRSTAGIDDPMRRHLARAAGRGQRDPVRPGWLEIDALHPAAVDDFDAGRSFLREEVILEAAAIELEGRHRREHRRPELEPVRNVAVVAVREKIPKPELFELPAAQVRLERRAASENSARRSRRSIRRP